MSVAGYVFYATRTFGSRAVGGLWRLNHWSPRVASRNSQSPRLLLQASGFCSQTWGFAPGEASLLQTLLVLPAVLREQAIVQHALRKTLVADALTLQMKLPPPGVPAPVARASPTVAGGTQVVDVVALTSVWVVHILRHLAQVRTTPLFALGIRVILPIIAKL